MSAEGGRQAVFGSQEIDGSGLAVILRHDAAIFSLISWDLVPGDDNLIDNLVPAKLVGVVLGQDDAHVTVLAARKLDGQPLHVRDELVDREDGNSERRERGSPGEEEDREKRLEPALARCINGRVNHDGAGGEVGGIDGSKIIILAFEHDEDSKADEVGPS